MKYYVVVGNNSLDNVVLDLVIVPEARQKFQNFEVSKATFMELWEERQKRHDIILDDPNPEVALKKKKFKFVPFNNVRRMKHETLHRFRQVMEDIITPTINIDYYRFTVANNVLCQHGFFITEQNRQEMYEKILREPDNGKLLEALNEYLMAFDVLSKYNRNLQVLRDFEDELQMTTTEQEIHDLGRRFMNKFRGVE